MALLMKKNGSLVNFGITLPPDKDAVYGELLGQEYGGTFYSITVTGDSHGGAATGAPTSVGANRSVSVPLVATGDYVLPATVTVTMGGTSTGNYAYSCADDLKSGAVYFEEATGDITITLVSVIGYQISENITNGRFDGNTSIRTGASGIQLQIVADNGYTFPPSTGTGALSVSGATLTSYDLQTGIVTISTPTGAVVISGTCPSASYTITTNVFNGGIIGGMSINSGETLVLQIVPDYGYGYPSAVSVIGATFSYNSTTGQITLSGATGNVDILARCTKIKYAISYSLTGISHSNVTEIAVGSTAKVTLTATESEKWLPNTVAVGNAYGGKVTKTSDTSGTITISNPSANVTVTGAAVTPYTITTGTITNGTKSGDTMIIAGESRTIQFVPNTHYTYPLTTDSITVTNATIVSYNADNGRLVINDATGNVVISADCQFIGNTFAADSWAGIKSAIKSGKDIYNLGDTKSDTIVLGGTTYNVTWRIVDNTVGRYGNKHKVIMMEELLPAPQQFDAVAPGNTTCWDTCDLNNVYLNTTVLSVLSAIPLDDTTVKASNGVDSGTILDTTSKLFIPCYTEIYGAEYSYKLGTPAEGSPQYAYFAGNNDGYTNTKAIKKVATTTTATVAQPYWLRSMYGKLSVNMNVLGVDDSGYRSAFGATLSTIYVPVCFAW